MLWYLIYLWIMIFIWQNYNAMTSTRIYTQAVWPSNTQKTACKFKLVPRSTWPRPLNYPMPLSWDLTSSELTSHDSNHVARWINQATPIWLSNFCGAWGLTLLSLEKYVFNTFCWGKLPSTYWKVHRPAIIGFHNLKYTMNILSVLQLI